MSQKREEKGGETRKKLNLLRASIYIYSSQSSKVSSPIYRLSWGQELRATSIGGGGGGGGNRRRRRRSRRALRTVGDPGAPELDDQPEGLDPERDPNLPELLCASGNSSALGEHWAGGPPRENSNCPRGPPGKVTLPCV